MSLRFPRALLTLLALATMAAACATATTPAKPAPSTPSATATAGQTAYPLSITQPDGTTAVIKAPPTRIVTVDVPVYGVEDLLALGVTPLGGEVEIAASPFGPQGIPSADHVSSFQPLGTAGKPDLEKIAAVHPDLIVGVNGKSTANLTQLEAIAPVADLSLHAEPTGTGVQGLPWYSELELLAKVLNRQAQANAFIAKFEAAAAAARPALTGKNFSFIQLQPNNIYVTGPTEQENKYLTYLGLTLAPLPAGLKAVGDPNEGGELSPERVGELTSQYLIVSGSSAATASFLASPLVKQLPAVKAGRLILTNNIAPTFGGYTTYGCIGQLDSIPSVPRSFTTTSAK